MGVIAHKTLCVTGELRCIQLLHNIAKRIYNKDTPKKIRMVTPIIRSPVNWFRSFYVIPDGGSETGEHSTEYDKLHDEMIKHLKLYSGVHYVIVQYGETGVRCLDTNCNNFY